MSDLVSPLIVALLTVQLSSVDSLLYPTKLNSLFRALWPYIPKPLLKFVEYVPTRDKIRYRNTLKVINRISKDLIFAKSQVMLAGDKSQKDIMSVVGESTAVSYDG